jgi:hypothetical protein
MFNLFKRSQPRYPTIRQALVKSGFSTASDPDQVVVHEQNGRYSGRQVNFFRVFEPGHKDVLLRSGHVERDGMVVLDRQPEAEGAVPVREPANRAKHTDDERLVFWDAVRANTSEALLSAPAATWQQARSSSTSSTNP